MASRLSQARAAVRPSMQARMMLSGPPGAGKSRSALIIATELAEGGTVLVIDTEKESALTYADDFDFEHLPWNAPYDPNELREALNEASGQYAVIVLDSFSHFWKGEGGVLDIAGGKFTGWKEARPAQEALVEAILNCNAHMILAVRSKVEHVQEQDAKGKTIVRKIGMADQQDDNLAFELNVALEISMDHTATVSKSRTTALPVGRSYGVSRTTELARIYGDWLKGGEPPASAEVVADLAARMNGLPADLRKACKTEFRNSFGLPEQLRESRVEHAELLVKGYEVRATNAALDAAQAQADELRVYPPDDVDQDDDSAGPGHSQETLAGVES